MAEKDLKERLKKRLADQKAKGQQGNIFFQKPDTTIRIRILNMGEEEEFIKEVTQFYLGSDIKGVVSPSTFGEPCAIMEAYESFKNGDDDDREIANKLAPRSKYLAFCIFYKDDKGKEVNEELSPKFILLSGGVYQEILELYLDENEWGDMTDPREGYDIKITRTGSGKTDTEYTVKPCKNTPTPKAYSKVYNLEKEIRKIMPTYEKTESLLEQFLGIDPDEANPKKGKKRKSDVEEDDDDNNPKRKRLTKKVRNRD